MKAYKIFRSDFTSVWNQPSRLYPHHYEVKYRWKLGKKNTHSKLYAASTLEETISWLVSANIEFISPKLMICEVEGEGLQNNSLDDQLKFNSITPQKIIPVSEYIHLIPKKHSLYTQIIESVDGSKI